MRYETKKWSITGAVKIGHHHHQQGNNCQDALAFSTEEIPGDNTFLFGVVCDGCGGVVDADGNPVGNTEVGAKLLSNYAVQEIRRLLRGRYTAYQIPALLFRSIVNYIDLHTYFGCRGEEEVEVVKLIEHFWLCTVLGFIIDEGDERGIFFYAGDGVIGTRRSCGLDEPLFRIDQKNEPTYPAYQCLHHPEKYGVQPKHIPQTFQTRKFESAVSKLMVATDGFETHNEIKLGLAKERQPDLPKSLHGLQWGKKGQTGLKRWMNSRSLLGYFDDDCALIVAEKK